MFCAGSNTLVTAKRATVSGSNCISPRACLGETARGLKLDSTAITLAINSWSTPCFEAAARISSPNGTFRLAAGGGGAGKDPSASNATTPPPPTPTTPPATCRRYAAAKCPYPGWCSPCRFRTTASWAGHLQTVRGRQVLVAGDVQPLAVSQHGIFGPRQRCRRQSQEQRQDDEAFCSPCS